MRSRSLCEDGGKRFAAPTATLLELGTCSAAGEPALRQSLAPLTRPTGGLGARCRLAHFFPSFIMRQIRKPHASQRGDTSSGHTAGPWDHYDYDDPNYPTIKIEDDRGDPIAYIDRSDRGPADSLANARLISVAPELLEILKRAKDQCERLPDNPATDELVHSIEAVISTAEGRDF